MTKLRVLFVSDVSYFKGGAERSIFDLMANPHIEPVLCVPEEGEISKAAAAKSIPYHTLDYGAVSTVHRPFKPLDIIRVFADALKAARGLKKLAKERNVLCVHTNGLKAHGVACLARLIGGRPVVIHFRAIPFTAPEKIFWNAVRMIASQVILVSRPCWHGKDLPRNVRVIFNGINLPEPDIVAKPANGRPFILGFTGRIQHTKGVDALIEWIEVARQKGLDVRLVIRGEAAPEDADYERKCRNMIAQRSLEDRIVFEGRVEGLDKIYGGIHASVVPSIIPDPLPRAVMEACALGIPVLGYPAGGIPYMFKDGASGFLVRDADEFCDSVKRLMDDPALYQSISAAAINNARENFAMPRLHAAVLDAYKTLS